MDVNKTNSFQCLAALDDLDYIPLNSVAEDILYGSIKGALEHIGKAYAKAVINNLCNLNLLSEREILTNCDLFEDSMYRLFGHGAVSVISKVKVLALSHAVMEEKSDLTIPEILNPSLTINGILNEIRRIEALDFVQKMASYNHIALLYSHKDFLNKVLSKYFSQNEAPRALLSENPHFYNHLNLTSSVSYNKLFGTITGQIKENSLIKIKEWIEEVRSTNTSNVPIRIAEDDATWWIKNGHTRALASIEQALCKSLPPCTSVLCAFDISKISSKELSTMKSIIGSHDYVITEEPSFTVYKFGKPAFRNE
jgi:hypothetical protein